LAAQQQRDHDAALQVCAGLGPYRVAGWVVIRGAILAKDLGAQLMGTRTSGSSRLWEDFVADHDSTLVARYRSARLNIFGDIVKLSRFGRDGFSPGPSGYHDKATRNGPRASCAQTSA